MHPASNFGNRFQAYLLKFGDILGKVCVFRIKPVVAGGLEQPGQCGPIEACASA